MKSILMTLNYFYPDLASTSQLFTELCERLQYDFNLTVICTTPSYTGLESNSILYKSLINYDKHNNIRVIRIRIGKVNKTSKMSRIKYVLSYSFFTLLVALKEKKHDIVFTISQPPILGGLLGVLIKFFKKSKLVYCIEDFNPEQIEAIRYTKNKLLIELARKLDNTTCKCSEKIIVLGRDMQEVLFNRIKNLERNRSVIINNWVNEREIYPLKNNNERVTSFISENGLKDKFIFMYSGNLGLYYDLDNLIKVFASLQDYNNVRFVFIGEGAKKNDLVKYINENKISNIIFLPYQPKEDLIYSLNAADVHIVTNAKGIKGVSVPSKIYAIMAVGKPILGILEDGSEAELLINASGNGIVSAPGDYSSLKENIIAILKEPDPFSLRGILGRTYLENNLMMDIAINKYRDLLSEL